MLALLSESNNRQKYEVTEGTMLNHSIVPIQLVARSVTYPTLAAFRHNEMHFLFLRLEKPPYICLPW